MIRYKLYRLLQLRNIAIDQDVFDYGWNTLTIYLKFLIVLIPLCLFFNVLNYTLFFLLFFIPLRRYIGGYHLNNKYSCLIASVVLALTVPYCAIQTSFIPLHRRIVILCICLFFILIIGTVDHPNKRLDIEEKVLFRKKAVTIILIYSCFICSFYKENSFIYLNILLYTIIFTTINLLISKIKIYMLK